MQVRFVNYTPTVQQVDEVLKAAILADPWQYRAEAEAIKQAEELAKDVTAVEKLDMPLSEYQERNARLERRAGEIDEILRTSR